MKQAAGILFKFPTGIDTICVIRHDHTDRTGVPCGKVEEGESTIAAALRETLEETGIDASNCKVLGEFTTRQSQNLVTIYMVEAPPELKDFKPVSLAEGRAVLGDITYLVGRNNIYRDFNEKMLRHFELI